MSARSRLTLAGLILAAWLSSPHQAVAEGSTQPAFEVSVQAPAPLDAFLSRHLALQRFRELPDLSPSELERLMAQAPDNVRELLGTQGYFKPEVEVTLTPRQALPPMINVHVAPGLPTRVALVQITLEGDALVNPDAAEQRARVHQEWGLPVGQVFTQSAWDDAKSSALRVLTQQSYPRAQIVNSLADIAAEQQQAHLYVVLNSGPPVAFGHISVEGAQRHDAEMVRRLVRLAGVRAGAPYDETKLQAAQQRLLDSGYYPSAFVMLAAQGDPSQHPVVARVREAPLQKVVLGAGVSTDRGARLTLEHTHHRLAFLGWRAVSQLQAELDHATAGLELSSPVNDRGWRWVTAGEAQRQRDGPRVTYSQQLRLVRAQDNPALDRSFFLQWDRSSLRDPARASGPDVATSVSTHYAWTRRAFDDLTAPQRGQGLAVDLGAGVTLTQEHRPYLRGRVRWLGYWPVAAASERPSRLALRLEGGAVWAPRAAPVPETQKFLAGGDQSVRGYGLREIGVPLPAGGVTAGKWLSLASLEWQRPIWRDGRKTAWESTLFLDTGAVANRPADLKPQVGLGAGVRYKSPVGPLQADLAYGVASKRLRLHLSVGFTF